MTLYLILPSYLKQLRDDPKQGLVFTMRFKDLYFTGNTNFRQLFFRIGVIKARKKFVTQLVRGRQAVHLSRRQHANSSKISAFSDLPDEDEAHWRLTIVNRHVFNKHLA